MANGLQRPRRHNRSVEFVPLFPASAPGSAETASYKLCRFHYWRENHSGIVCRSDNRFHNNGSFPLKNMLKEMNERITEFTVIQSNELTAITSLPTQIVSSASDFILVHLKVPKQHSRRTKIRKQAFLWFSHKAVFPLPPRQIIIDAGSPYASKYN